MIIQAIILTAITLFLLRMVVKDLIVITKEVFKTMLLVVAFSFTATAQTSNPPCKLVGLNEGGVFKQSTNKQDKTTTTECLWVNVCENIVEFRVTNTSVQTFVRRGSEWMTFGTEKFVQRSEQADGSVVFFMGTTAFIYKPNKK